MPRSYSPTETPTEYALFGMAPPPQLASAVPPQMPGMPAMVVCEWCGSVILNSNEARQCHLDFHARVVALHERTL